MSYMGGMDHSKYWEKRMRAGAAVRGMAGVGCEGKSSLGRNSVASIATSGGWIKPLADTVSMTAFLRHEVGMRQAFSRCAARSCKCLNPKL